MPRQIESRKTVEIGTVKHPTLKGPAIPVTMKPGETLFRAKVRGADIHDKTFEGIEKQILARLEATASLEWTPVIELALAHEGVLNLTDGIPTGALASLKFGRYWLAVAEKPDDGIKEDHRGSWSGKLMAPFTCKTDAQRLAKARNCYLYFKSGDFRQFSDRLGFPRNPDGSLQLPAKINGHSGLELGGSVSNEAYLIRHTDAVWATLEAIVQRLHETRAQLKRMVSSADSVAQLEQIGNLILAGGTLGALGAGEKGNG